jgi:energy-converting hydrogenase A subunit R
MPNLQLNIDCESSLALHDYAFELCREFIKPQGDRFFRQVSRYGDYLAGVAKKQGFKSGDTLKLILPFLKAHGLTNAKLEAYARGNLTLVTGAEGAFKFLHTLNFPIFEISTSYRPFAEAVGLKLGFSKERILATELDLDRYSLSEAEAEELRRLLGEIVATPVIELPSDATEPADLPAPGAEAIAVLDQIFWERLPAMEIGALCQEVNPIGGPEKAKAVTESFAKSGLSLADTIYVGSSVTDVQAFEEVREGTGLAISFNGAREAVNAAEVIVVADSAWPLALLTAIFQLWGKQGVLEVASPETREKSRSLVLPEAVIEPIGMGLEGHVFNLYDQSAENLDQVIEESQAMRAKLRGNAVAARG